MTESRSEVDLEQEPAVDRAMRWIELLASEVGPRRPTSRSERVAAELMRSELAALGVAAELEPFDGYASFFRPYAAILATAAAPSLLPRGSHLARSSLALTAAASMAAEGGLVHTPLSRALSRRRSQNLVATIEPAGDARRTLCLVSHIDSSRSGLMFHAALAPYLGRWIALQGAAVLVGAAEPLLGRLAAGRLAIGVARAIAAVGLALLVERELRGADVPGASDNGSGVAVTATLAAELAAAPLDSTRVVLLVTGCEEAGLLGMQAFLRAREREVERPDWLFLNVDSVGGAATLRYLRREGVLQKWEADAGLVSLAERLRRERPDLGLAPADRPAGLTYDATAALARGHRAMTLSAQDETIPNLHLPTDTYGNVDRDSVGRTLATARELIVAIDRGGADA